ncbi:MAG: hypothetical protein Q4D48_08825 [Coriobacteriales bacterium]|nr:hypothetical protein [Coriobacteriales bacterium]
MLVVLEGIVMCFVLLFVCVVGIANGPVGLVTFYEPEVQDRVVELGLTTRERIKRNTALAALALFVPALLLVPYMVYGVNGAVGFREGFTQMLVISLIYGLFDRLFIDWWWVGHTRTWIIPGTEDLMPYIAGKTLVVKWVGTLVGFPLMYALIAWIVALVG